MGDAGRTTEQGKRRRRSSDTVDALIRDAARELFAARGYRASTRAIAERASVPEPLLFRRFGSKAALFEATVSQALLDFYEAFDASHRAVPDDDAGLARRGTAFTAELVALVERNRRLIFSYLSAVQLEPEFTDMPVSDALTRYFERAEQNLERRYSRLGVEPSIKPAVTARLAFLTVVSAVLFGDWVFRDLALDHAALVAGLDQFVLRDVTARPSPSPGDTE